MGHTVSGLMEGIGQTRMTRLEVADGRIHFTGMLVVMGSTLIVD